MKKSSYFSPASLRFLSDLAANNNREWFTAHKAEFEQDLKAPFLRLIGDLQEPLRDISAHFIADPRPVGGSMFRLHRDTRFAADKSPYKTWLGARFYHRRSQELSGEAPVFYVHIQPGGSFVGGGVWHPAAPTLAHIRNYLVNNPNSWQKITQGPKFSAIYKLGGEQLSRAPRGYDPAHPLVADLRRKDFVCTAPLSDAQILSPQLLDILAEHYQRAAPLIDWLSGALDLEF